MTINPTRPKWWQLYLTVPLLIVILWLDPRLDLSLRGHQAVQIGIVLVFFMLMHLWLNANRAALAQMEARRLTGANPLSGPQAYRKFDARQVIRQPVESRNPPRVQPLDGQPFQPEAKPTLVKPPREILAQIRPAIVLLLSFTLITGLIYPLVVTEIAQAVFPRQANGSWLVVAGQIYGSELIGQPFDDPKYFWGRPSAVGYDAAASSGSYYGPSNPALLAAVRQRVAALRAADPGNLLPIPVDLVTASASGLDPHISVAAALYQLESRRPRGERSRTPCSGGAAH